MKVFHVLAEIKKRIASPESQKQTLESLRDWIEAHFKDRTKKRRDYQMNYYREKRK